MSKENNLNDFLLDIASAIRNKKGITNSIPAQQFSTEIASIETGVSLEPLSQPASAKNIWYGLEAYDASGTLITGTLPYHNDISQTIDGINSTSVTIPSGISDGGVISLTSDIQDEVDIQTGLINDIISILQCKAIQNDPNLLPENIKKGVVIGGVVGTYEGE